MKHLLFAFCVLLSTQMLVAQESAAISGLQYTEQDQAILSEAKTIVDQDFKKGYRGDFEFEIGLSYGSGYLFDIGFLTTHGYQLNPWVFVGGGIGVIGTLEKELKSYKNKYGYINYKEDAVMSFAMPIYASIRLYMTKRGLNRKGINFYFDAKLGGLVPFNEFLTEQTLHYSRGSDTYKIAAIQKNGGLYFRLGLGLELRHFTFGINYGLLGVVSNYDTSSYDHLRYDYNTSLPSSVNPKTINPGTITYTIAVNF